jgi:hypothetical protein
VSLYTPALTSVRFSEDALEISEDLLASTNVGFFSVKGIQD